MNPSPTKPILLIALGGNAFIRKGQAGTAEEQFRNLAVPIRQIAALAECYRLIITHGNGPQVGNLLLQEESCNAVPKLPLELLVAQTQGQMGYMIESALDGALMALGHGTDRHFISLISYVVVNPDDPAFSAPSKPIGPAFSREQAMMLPYPTQRTARGYRRVVASPEPVTIVEKREIRDLISRDYIVICCGGGGIPVVRHGRSFTGVHAVIDKDLASEKLAEESRVDVFLIATNVEGAMLNFGTPRQKLLSNVSVPEARQYIAEGHFRAGSMAPKVEAAIRFMQQGGERAIICSIEEIEAAVAGDAGTQFFARASSLPTAET